MKKRISAIFPLILAAVFSAAIMTGCGSSEGDEWTLTRITNFGDHPVYSPDGSKIVFAGVSGGSIGIWLFQYGMGVEQLLEMSVNYDYTWAPGSDRIVFSNPSAGSSGGLWISDLDGNLTHLYSEGRNPAWSPDGTFISFQSGAGVGLYRIPADSGAVAQLTFIGENPEYSPDGNYLAFVAHYTSPTVVDSLYRYSFGSGNYTAVSAGGANFAWSPDGDEIVYDRYEAYGGSGYQLLLRKYSFNTQSSTVLWPGGTAPAWASDNSRIAFVSLAGDVSDGILVMSPSGGNVEEVTGIGEAPNFGNSGNKLTYSSNSGVWVAQR